MRVWWSFWEAYIILNGKKSDFTLYDEFLSHENRYLKLKRNSKDLAKELLDNQKEWAMKRYEYYSKLDSNNS